MSARSLFKWRHFLPEFILLNVSWYCRYALSYRDLEEIMKVKSKWQVEFWNKEDALPRLITNRLVKAVELAPRPGWVPGTSMPQNLEREIETILKPCRSQGITKVVPNGKADSNTMEANLEMAHEIRIITTSGTRFLDGYRRAISKALSIRCDCASANS